MRSVPRLAEAVDVGTSGGHGRRRAVQRGNGRGGGCGGGGSGWWGGSVCGRVLAGRRNSHHYIRENTVKQVVGKVGKQSKKATNIVALQLRQGKRLQSLVVLRVCVSAGSQTRTGAVRLKDYVNGRISLDGF